MNTKKIIDTIIDKYNRQIIEYYIIPRLMFRENMVFVDVNNNRYIVKKYPLNIENQYLYQLSQLYDELSAGSIITNCICKQATGVPFFEMNDGKYMVYTYVDGTKCDLELIGCDLSNSLKCLHDKLSQISHGVAMTKTSEQIDLCMRNIDNWVNIDELSGKIVDSKDYFKEILSRYLPEKTSIIHGDCTRNNVLRSSDDFVFIDFDNYKIGDPLEDLANLINSVLYDNEFINKYEKIRAINNLVIGYGATNDDIEKIQLYMKINCIIELQKHQENYKFLKRNPGTSNYLSKLFYIITQEERSF